MFRINVNLSQISELASSLQHKAKPVLQAAVRRLSVQTKEHIVERVNATLHSTRNMYLKHLHREQVNDNTTVIWIDPEIVFLEDGMSAHEMIDDILSSPKAKTAKDGSKYLAVPLRQNKLPQDTPQAGMDLRETLMKFMNSRQGKQFTGGWGKIDVDSQGKPKLGLLASFNIPDQPLKIHEGAYQGWGPIGEVRQGPTGIPFLQGVRVYQRMGQGPDGKEMVMRDIMTFRMISSKMKGTGRWTHPGLPARHFLDEAYQWALEQWEKDIKPDVIEQLTQ